MIPTDITLTCPELGGGWGRVIVNLANAFVRENQSVHILLEKTSGPFIGQLKPGIKISSVPTTHTTFGIPFMGAHMVKYKPRVIITPVVRHTILALRTRRFFHRDTQVFATLHTTYGKAAFQMKNSKRKIRMKKIKANYPQCDGIIAVSQGVKEDFCSMTSIPREKVTVLHNPIVTSHMEELAKSTPDHPWFTNDHSPVVLGVGRLAKPKNFKMLIDAFVLVRQKINCRLVIIGEGSERAKLEKHILSGGYESDIALIGYQKNPYQYIRRASVLVLSSLWEGLPTVLVEALALGTPVASTDCPSGPREILDNGRLGPIVPPGDPNALAEAILKVIDNPLPAETLRSAVDNFRAENVAQQYLKLFGFR